MQDIFIRLKSQKKFSKKPDLSGEIYFMLNNDDKGFYIEIVNEKYQRITDIDYKNYNNEIREALKYIENVKRRNIFVIDWYQTDKNKIYLSEHEYLIDLLKNSTALIDGNFKKLKFQEGKQNLLLNIISNDKGKTETYISLGKSDIKSFAVISEKYILNKNIIYEVNPIGERFKDLEIFNTVISIKDLEKFLSVFYSYFENIDLNYNNYEVIKGDPVNTLSTLIFEEVDTDNCLHIRVSETLKGFDPDFVESYNISKVAQLNDLENKITINDVINQSISNNISEINKLLGKHKKNLDNLSSFFNEDNIFIIDEELAKLFIHKELTNLLLKFDIFGSEKLKSYNIKTVTPKLKLSLSSGIDFFEGDATLEIEGQFISAIDAINFYNKNSYIHLNDGTNAIVKKSYIDKLNRIFKKKKDKIRISFFDLPLIEELIEEKVFNDNFKEYKEVFLGFNKLNEKETKLPNIKAELRSYQIQGFKWMDYLYQHSLGGCLADDMGLGKTLQTITLLSKIYPKEKTPSLIIMPKSLLFNWENELKKFNDQISYYIYYGNNRDLKSAQDNNLILTTYAMIRNEIETFKEINFHCIVLDESQNIKNATTQSSKAVMLLNSKYRFALSGTPIENNLGELYSLFRFLNPSMFGSADDFNANYLIPIQKYNDKDLIHELKKKIYPFILRRLKKDVLKDLPDKVEQTLYIDMNDKQKKLYDERKNFYSKFLKEHINLNGIKKSQFFIFQALTELRQIASIPESKSDNNIISPKREVLIESICEVIANGHKALIFANYLDAVELISQDLEKNGIEHLIMTGATKDRQELVDKFQSQDKYKAFLMTLKTGGLGLNLTAADFVFIFDPWWNKSAENQAIDRAHRMGQDRTVFSYKLITKNTIEEKILLLQEKKTELVDNIISTDDNSIKSFTEEDINFILGD